MDEIVFDRIIANLKSLSGENGVVTSEQINDAAGSEVVDAVDVEELLAAIERAGLVWEDPDADRPVFPPGYTGPRLV